MVMPKDIIITELSLFLIPIVLARVLDWKCTLYHW